MDAKQIAILAGAAVLIVGAILIYTSGGSEHGENNANFPDGTFWICSSPSCKHEFNLSMQALSDHHKAHRGEPIPCPKCNSDSTRANRCPHCEKYSVLQRDSTVCPHCKQDTAK